MSKSAMVRPATGTLVRHENPGLGYVEPEGEHVIMSQYYRRRVRDGDLFVLPEREPKKPAK